MRKITDFCWIYTALAAFCVSGQCVAAQMPNPRSASSAVVTGARGASKTLVRGDGDGAVVTRDVARSAARSGTNQNVVSRSVTSAKSGVARSVSNVSARSATRSIAGGANVGRSASQSVARAGTLARATAVFNDISKIGGGYATCRDAYATCMDQFCAKANDTYRRCYCSAKYTEFRNTEEALDAAATLLQQFEDRNLSAVDKTAAEVNAMYSATVGELAVKNDVSGAQAILNEISDLLSGKKKASDVDEKLGLMPVDFATDMSDIWGDTGSSIFGSGTDADELLTLEGKRLYDAANDQCLQIIADSCENSAVLNMATSAYNIMMTQDCNVYERTIVARRETVEDSVRQMENALRAARLEEYRNHNSADVNECLSRVKTAMTADVVCGANYNHCMDFSGRYVNQTTGELRYTPKLFELKDLIKLDGTDVLGANPDFNKELDARRLHAESVLQTCRDISDIVWSEFKRQAIIEIAQAQADKIEEVKMSCVNTMKVCYDKTGTQLASFDVNTAGLVGALAASASREMCVDKVSACISLFAKDPTKCQVGENGKINDACEYSSLITLVNTVDDERVAEGCKTGLENYARELCTPTSGDKGYPWNCIGETKSALETKIKSKKDTYCASDVTGLNEKIDVIVADAVSTVESAIIDAMMNTCEDFEAVWWEAEPEVQGYEFETAFYQQLFGETTNIKNAKDGAYVERGYCIVDSERWTCEQQDDITGTTGSATWNSARQECEFATSWYEWTCANMLGGYWKNNTCYWNSTGVGEDERDDSGDSGGGI